MNYNENTLINSSYLSISWESEINNIEFRLNSQIAGLTKSIESVDKVIDSLERQRNYHSRQNGSNVGEEQAYNNFQEILGNKLAEIRQLLTGYEYARDIALEEKRAAMSLNEQRT